MAIKEILVDDINGEDYATTVPFSVRDKQYEIHLAKRGEKAFDDALKQFIAAARVVTNGSDNAKTKRVSRGAAKAKRRAAGGHRSNGSKSPVKQNADELRAWAKANGHNVAERGRISADVREAFEKSKLVAAEPQTTTLESVSAN